jgi:hypothetical protein
MLFQGVDFGRYFESLSRRELTILSFQNLEPIGDLLYSPNQLIDFCRGEMQLLHCDEHFIRECALLPEQFGAP